MSVNPSVTNGLANKHVASDTAGDSDADDDHPRGMGNTNALFSHTLGCADVSASRRQTTMSSHMRKPTTFVQFRRLPVEIQNMVWNYATLPIVNNKDIYHFDIDFAQVHVYHPKYDFIVPGFVACLKPRGTLPLGSSGLLEACRSSRTIALRVGLRARALKVLTLYRATKDQAGDTQALETYTVPFDMQNGIMGINHTSLIRALQDARAREAADQYGPGILGPRASPNITFDFDLCKRPKDVASDRDSSFEMPPDFLNYLEILRFCGKASEHGSQLASAPNYNQQQFKLFIARENGLLLPWIGGDISRRC